MRKQNAVPRQKTSAGKDINSGEEVYLCQVSQDVSCGACCGLYNVADPSRSVLCSLLERRTREFSRVSREIEAILDFGSRESEKTARAGHPIAGFHHCPYLGFVGERKSRVGCLLHPMAEGNNGVDFRGLSHYGSMTCSIYFCPAHTGLPADFKQIMREAVGDWYLFGLVVQETDLLRAVHEEIVRRCSRDFPGPDSVRDPERKKAWKELFALKLTWPFARQGRVLARYLFNDSPFTRPEVDYSATGRTGSAYNPIFRELDSVFCSGDDLIRAEQVLNGLFEKITGV